MKFVDVKNDVAFRKIFGNEQKTQILISFLNAVLKLENENKIREVKIINPYLLPRVAGEKASIIDVRAKDEKGRQYVIEMQMAHVDGFKKRVLYYTCRDYSMQIERGEQYPLLRPTYFIGILDFEFLGGTDYLNNHIFMDEKTHEQVFKDLRMTFIRLRNFNKQADELETLIEKWVFFIKNAENLRVIPENTDDEGLKEAYNDADKHSWKKEELIAYDNASIAEQDIRGRLSSAERTGMERGMKKGMEKGMKKGMEKGIEKGIEKGMKKGIQEGEKQEKAKVVERCYLKKMSTEDIAEISELTVQEVEKIIEKLKGEKGVG